MAIVVQNEIEYDHHFDQKTNRHYINGILSVLHCHHYTSLYTQLALDAGETDLLKECARDSFRAVLLSYFSKHPNHTTLQDKVAIGSQYYSLLGLGSMEVKFIGKYSGLVELPFSHTDSGWIKKWGEYDKPINYITGGFIEALFEVCFGLPSGSFNAFETQSIVMGAASSIFKVTKK
ncbi:hypothetical protein [Aureispira anguillae]|uniref:Uncharacterized protein n=1 Tax=Aureispira anguillae TaxID=2864201 RepID=A0A915YLD8_9BACT|nr:hypothetical protein [Aureispira anguillae]BDS15067.1 hypothetical protein AsAng_0058490 [Aureispira anguillae]